MGFSCALRGQNIFLLLMYPDGIRVLEGSDAARCGKFEPGDILQRVNGMVCSGLRIGQQRQVLARAMLQAWLHVSLENELYAKFNTDRQADRISHIPSG